MPRSDRVPLVVVTGFLGAGKTTLVNRLLARRAARAVTDRLGVIVNELGEIGIDGALLDDDASRQVELPGGCVCCVLGDELDRTLIDLVERNPELAAIVLETTGVAEPLPIAWAVRRAPVCDRIRLAAVVTVVDATRFEASRPLSVAVDAQVAYADVVLIAKAELAGGDDTARAEAAVRALAPRAVVRRGTTDDHAAWLETVLADPDVEHTPAAAPHVHDEHCGHDHDRGDDRALHGIASIAIEITGVVELEELEDQLAELPASYIRIKGIARAVDERGELVWAAVHRVGPRVSSEPLARPPAGFTGDRGRLVALGSGLEPAALRECVAAALQARRSA